MGTGDLACCSRCGTVTQGRLVYLAASLERAADSRKAFVDTLVRHAVA